MPSKPSLSAMRILITNDDGINSNGLKALERIANLITPDVWIVAPEVSQSGKGFSVSFESVLRIKQLSPRRFSVSGTPADCVFIAIGEVLKDRKPDLVLSGINLGSNVGDFIGISGTIGATFAAASQDIKAIAVSQDCKRTDITKFPVADYYLDKIIKKLVSFEWSKRVCMNVNFPDVQNVGEISGIKIAHQGRFDVIWDVHKRFDPVKDPYYWLHANYKDVSTDPAADSMIISEGKYITVGALQCRQGFEGCDKKLEELFSSNV